MSDALPPWVARHQLEVGQCYVTRDSDLTLEFLGCAQVRDSYGFTLVMVFREVDGHGPMLTMNEHDADSCAGFTPLGDHLLGGLRDDT